MAKTPEIDPNIINQIVEGTIITGNIVSEKSIRIVGTLEGNLTTKGRAVIGKTGVVSGNIICQEGDIEGKVSGKIITYGLLSLRASAVVNSETYTKQLMVEPGAIINGTLDMSGTNLNPEQKQVATPNGQKKEEKSLK